MNTSSRYQRRKTNNRKRLKKSILLSILIIILLVFSYVGYVFFEAYHAAKESYQPIDRGGKSKLRKEAVTIGKDPISILLMGIENYSTGGKDGRTDTLIVVTLNPHDHTMKMVSIPRDTRVMIAGKNEMDKINAAHVYGAISGYGANKATINTVENYLHIPIDYYVKVDFNGFVKLINEVNGVNVNVPFDFWEYDIITGKRTKVYFKKGEQHLNGKQALAYVRMRKRDPRGDFGRNDRQKQVIKAAIKKATSANMLFKVNDITQLLGQNIQTNLTPNQIFGLQQAYSQIKPDHIESISLDKGKNAYLGSNHIYYFVPDEDYVKKISDMLNKELETTSTSSTTSSDK